MRGADDLSETTHLIPFNSPLTPNWDFRTILPLDAQGGIKGGLDLAIQHDLTR